MDSNQIDINITHPQLVDFIIGIKNKPIDEAEFGRLLKGAIETGTTVNVMDAFGKETGGKLALNDEGKFIVIPLEGG